LGLTAALQEYAVRLSTDGLRISIIVETLQTLTAAVEVAVYRIVTEALTNVVHHAHGRQASVHLWCADMLNIEIEDDGAGLPSHVHAGVGLTSMRERAEELGGTCRIERRAEGGTRVVAELPLGR
jgi:signal transduction histidine kinase